MVVLKAVTGETALQFKSVRLRALKDSPFAFGSTFEKEAQLSDEEWQERAAERDGNRSVTFLAWHKDGPCGIAAGFVDAEDAAKAHLVSVWVDPAFRKTGVGHSLVDCVIDWAKSRKASRLFLMVTSSNPIAERFYEGIGFKRTGHSEPYPNAADVVEFEMVLNLH